MSAPAFLPRGRFIDWYLNSEQDFEVDVVKSDWLACNTVLGERVRLSWSPYRAPKEADLALLWAMGWPSLSDVSRAIGRPLQTEGTGKIDAGTWCSATVADAFGAVMEMQRDLWRAAA